MADTKDFIPAGEDTGAIANGGYQDFVPALEPIKQPEIVKPLRVVDNKVVVNKPHPKEPTMVPPVLTTNDVRGLKK